MLATVSDHGTIVTFTFDEEGTQWVDLNTATEGWQWMGDFTLAVDHRHAAPFANYLEENGFYVVLD